MERIVAGALLLSSLACIVLSYLAGHPFRAYLIENSDLLYLPALFADVLSGGGRIADWYLTPAPYFFPDYPIYFGAYAAGWDTYSRIVLFSVAQTMLVFAAVWLLAKQVEAPAAFILAVTVTIALVWLALNAGEPFVLF